MTLRKVKAKVSISSSSKFYDSGIYKNQIETSIQGFRPGEWAIIDDGENQRLGFVNPMTEDSRPCIWIVGELSIYRESEEQTIKVLIDECVKRRQIFFPLLGDNFRLAYGQEDSLPGLVVDVYNDAVLVDVHTAGLDRYLELIFESIKKHYPNKKYYFFANQELRKRETLPIRNNDNPPAFISISEGLLKLEISGSNLQKVGYYFDHRTNRERLKMWITRLFSQSASINGLDLFCYIGSWGISMLQAGCNKVDFIDQADMESTINKNLSLNDLSERGRFAKGDVFQVLDKYIAEGTKFNVIVSDPPAFAKNQEAKNAALSGYRKLHSKILKVIQKNGILFVGSCTHYVDLFELEKTVIDAARTERRKIQLIDLGAQSPDHPISALKSKSSYLKGLYYFVE